MKGTLVITHKSIGHKEPERNRLLQELDRTLKPSKIEDHKVALKESREFSDQVSELLNQVFYAFRPSINSIVICFRRSDTYFEVHVESQSMKICDICERASEELGKVFNGLKKSPKFRITLEEDDGEQTGILGEGVTFMSLLKERIKKENLYSAIIAAICSLVIAYCWFRESLPSAIVAGVSLVAVLIFLLFSCILERWIRQVRFRWKFER